MKTSRNYFLLCIIAFLEGFVFYGPIATVYRQSRGISIYEIFLIESIFMVLMILFEVPWGWFADRFGYKTTMVSSLFLSFISKFVFYKAHSFELFLLERVLLALSLSGVSGCDAAMLFSSIDEKQSEKAFGRYYSLSTLGFLLATSAYSLIVTVSMEMTALLTMIPYGISVVVALFLIEVKAKDEKRYSIGESLKEVLGNKQTLIFILAVALISEAAHSATVFLNQLQYQRSGIDIMYFGVILAAIQLVTILSSRVYMATGRLGQERTINIIYIIMALSFMILSLTGRPASSVLLIAVISLGSASVMPVSSDIQNKSVKTSNRATILSAYAMLIDMVSAVVNLGIGKSANLSVQAAFAVCAGISLAALALNIYYFRLSRVKPGALSPRSK